MQIPEFPIKTHSSLPRMPIKTQHVLLELTILYPKQAARPGPGALIPGIVLVVMAWSAILPPLAFGRHQGHKEHQAEFEHIAEATEGHVIAGVPFRVYLNKGREEDIHQALEEPGAGLALRTVVEAFDHMVAHRKEFARFDEALTKGVLQKVIIVPEVKNREGKEFFLLVTRTAEPGQVQLLINASILEQQGYFNHPDQLVPVLAREFQWVVSKADTTPKRRTGNIPADPRHAPILSHQEIRVLSGEEREHRLQEIFRTYLTTTDRYESLQGLHFYEIGTTKKVPPAQPDSTAKLYDIRAREALQTIVRDPYFQEHTPKAVQSLLNGKIWNVAFVHIPERDWATRTRVVPEDQAIKVGSQGKTIQPAAVLINIYRQASPEDPFFAETNGLPMGALPTDILARVIAWEIHHNITEKSMRGHVAEDARTTPE